MRIAYLTPTSIYSGGEKITLDIAKGMRRRGHEVVYCGLAGPIRNAVESVGIPFYELEAFTVVNVYGCMRALSPDLVHCMDFRASTYAALLSWPFVAHLHNNPMWLRGINSNACGMLLFALRAKALITVSQSVWDEFRMGKLIPSRVIDRRLHMLPNCVDVEMVLTKSKLYQCESFDLVFMGRFVDQKRPELFVRTVAAVRERFPSVRAVMLGDGPQMSAVRQLLSNLKLESVIELVGVQENPFPWLAASKILVMPSAWEGFGLAAVEALALGKPVVACAVGGLKGIVDRSCGQLCTTTRELSGAACDLLADPERYLAASDAARCRALNYVHYDAYYAKIENCYHE